MDSFVRNIFTKDIFTKIALDKLLKFPFNRDAILFLYMRVGRLH